MTLVVVTEAEATAAHFDEALRFEASGNLRVPAYGRVEKLLALRDFAPCSQTVPVLHIDLVDGSMTNRGAK
jgi:hypothetical protein